MELELAYAPKTVYCDMTNGGWTRVVVITSDHNHKDAGPFNEAQVANGSPGKYSEYRRF